jgi:SAM-dependent methyltransferase
MTATTLDAPRISYPEGGNAACAQVEDSSFWFRHRNRVILDQLERFPPAGPLWDIGGGNGFVSAAMQNAGYEVVLVEPGAIGCRTAEARGVRRVCCGTLEEQSPPPGSIAAAGLFDVLEHIQDDLGFLETLATALQPGGRLFLTVPAFNALWSAEDDHAGHFRRYTVRTLSKVLGEAGFAVEFASPFFGILTLPLFAVRTVPSILGVRSQVKADTTAKEHTAPAGIFGRMFDRVLGRERQRLKCGRRMRVGTSLIAVARRAGSRQRPEVNS